MAYMGANARAEVNPQHPEAWAICDRCGFLRNHEDLRFQMEWRGNDLLSTGFLVCHDTCYDVPYEFNRPIILPQDPAPVKDARPPSWIQQSGQAPAPPTPVQQGIEPDE